MLQIFDFVTIDEKHIELCKKIVILYKKELYHRKQSIQLIFIIVDVVENFKYFVGGGEVLI